MSNIYCLMHARNQRSNSSVVMAYSDKDKCIRDLNILQNALASIRIRKKEDTAINRTRIQDAKAMLEKYHPDFDFNLNRTMNDMYWIEEVELA